MIYTKTGDKGETSLASGQRVPKTDARIEAYGTVDELNSWVGALRAALKSSNPNANANAATNPNANADANANSIDQQLEWVQNKLFNLGADLSDAPGEWILEEDVKLLELWIDDIQTIVPKQRAFLLPTGSEPVTRAHICRTICRRAERRMLTAQASQVTIRYINRLSDYFFVLSRLICFHNGERETEWKRQ